MTNKERFKEIFISQVTRPGAADLLAWLGTTDFFEAPASTRFHGAYPGGLVEHSLNVYYVPCSDSLPSGSTAGRVSPSWRCCMMSAKPAITAGSGTESTA